MPATVPRYLRHKGTGQAVTYVGARVYYLGKYRSADSHKKHRELIARWAAGTLEVEEPTPTTVNELLLLYLRWAKVYYRKNGKVTSQVTVIKATIRGLKELFGALPVAEFGSPALAAFRDYLVKAPGRGVKSEPLARTEINRRVRVVRQIFRWGQERRLTNAAKVAELKNVLPLYQGRCEARENPRRLPVTTKDIEATMPHLPPTVADIVRLNVTTGARPSEILCMRWADIDTSGDVWLYRPIEHKNSHLEGKTSVIGIGQQGQAVLEKYREVPPEEFIFSPARAEEARRAKVAADRKTPAHHGNAPGSNRKRRPKVRPGDRYNAASYRRAVERACIAAGVPKWSPYQLRHRHLTDVCDLFGIETASRVANHASTQVTRRVYTITATGPVAEAARALG